MEIINEDNPPVKITAVNAFQLNRILLAYFDPTVNYHLIFGNPLAPAPNYDLAFFQDSTASALEVGTGLITGNNIANPTTKTAGSNEKLILWIVIFSVLALLLILTLRMVKEMKKNEHKDQ